jgi:hypothetical protein
VATCFFSSGSQAEADTDWKLPLAEFSNRKASATFTRQDSKGLSRRTRKYYKAQDKLIEEYEALEEKGVSDEEDGQEGNDILSLRLSQVSLACNFVSDSRFVLSVQNFAVFVC